MQRRSFITGIAGILAASQTPAFQIIGKPMVVPRRVIAPQWATGGICSPIRNEAYDDFVAMQLRQIVMGMGITYGKLARESHMYRRAPRVVHQSQTSPAWPTGEVFIQPGHLTK